MWNGHAIAPAVTYALGCYSTLAVKQWFGALSTIVHYALYFRGGASRAIVLCARADMGTLRRIGSQGPTEFAYKHIPGQSLCYFLDNGYTRFAQCRARWYSIRLRCAEVESERVRVAYFEAA